MTNFFKKHKGMVLMAMLLVFAIIFILVLVAVPKTKITQILPNDTRYCYAVKDLANVDDPMRYLNVSDVYGGDIDKSFTNIILSTYSENGNKVIIDSRNKNIIVDIADGDLIGKIEIFCLSNIDDEYFRQSVCGIKLINTGGDVEINFTRKNLMFRINEYDDGVNGGVLLQYLVRIK